MKRCIQVVLVVAAGLSVLCLVEESLGQAKKPKGIRVLPSAPPLTPLDNTGGGFNGGNNNLGGLPQGNQANNQGNNQGKKKGDQDQNNGNKKTKLPDGEGYNLVVQFKQTAEAKPQNFRFKLDLHTCGECKRAEYACICGH